MRTYVFSICLDKRDLTSPENVVRSRGVHLIHSQPEVNVIGKGDENERQPGVLGEGDVRGTTSTRTDRAYPA